MKRPRRRRTISIRWSLFKNLLVLIVLISGSLLIYSAVGADRAIRALTESLFKEASVATEDELATFFSPIAKSIEIVAKLGERDVFSPEDPESAARVLIPVLLANPQMSSVNTGDGEGNALLIVRREQEWLAISIRGGTELAEWRQVDESGAIIRAWQQKTDFDPRTRPWYELALRDAPERIRWTAPYDFVPTADPGITASVPVDRVGGGYVLAFDILLEHLAAFGQEIVVPGNGTAFVLSDDGGLIVPPVGAMGEVRDLLLKRPEDLEMPLVSKSIGLWREDPTSEPFEFEHGGESWWGVFKPYEGMRTRKFWIGVLIPERHLAGERRRDQYALLLVTILALGVATLMALLLSRSYSSPLQELVEHSSRLENLRTDAEVVIHSRLTEVRRLAEAQEKMRRALDSFARYVPLDVVRELLDRGEAAKVGGGRETQVTVLFTDIVGFTTIAESMTAAELTRHMSSYFDGMVGILHRHGATVDKFIGDAVMAFWGAPKPLGNHSLPAVEAVLEIREWLEESNRRWRSEGLPELPTRFGLASGVVTAGNVGADRRLSYTVLGDPVNLARRLEELNSALGTTVLVAEAVREAAGETFEWRDADSVTVKGKSVSVRVFELLGRVVTRD